MRDDGCVSVIEELHDSGAGDGRFERGDYVGAIAGGGPYHGVDDVFDALVRGESVKGGRTQRDESLKTREVRNSKIAERKEGVGEDPRSTYNFGVLA